MWRISLFVISIWLLGISPAPVSSPERVQNPTANLDGKHIGIYISSRAFGFDEGLNMQITQFLTIGEDRSYAGQLKPELMIRLGWLLTEQLGALSGADTVHFLNADPPRGKAFRNLYDAETNQVRKQASAALADMDYVFVLNEFQLDYRMHRSSYVSVIR